MPKHPVDEYLDTINRLEPNVCAIDASAFYASTSISLKRIADTLERISAVLEEMNYDRTHGR